VSALGAVAGDDHLARAGGSEEVVGALGADEAAEEQQGAVGVAGSEVPRAGAGADDRGAMGGHAPGEELLAAGLGEGDEADARADEAVDPGTGEAGGEAVGPAVDVGDDALAVAQGAAGVQEVAEDGAPAQGGVEVENVGGGVGGAERSPTAEEGGGEVGDVALHAAATGRARPLESDRWTTTSQKTPCECVRSYPGPLAAAADPRRKRPLMTLGGTDHLDGSMLVQPFILCGGAGSRLWPASQPQTPKPLLPLGPGQTTLLAATLARLEPPLFGAPRLICGARHLAAIRAQEPSLSCIVEPIPRGTAAAVIAAAATAREGLVLVLPADHAVADNEALCEAVETGMAAAARGDIVIFGVRPDRPATGYGWIALAEALAPRTHRVESFREKPSQSEAQRLLDSGNHVWNSGMFLFDAAALLAEARRLAPELTEHAVGAVTRCAVEPTHMTLDAPSLASCESQSFDVAVMERTNKAAVVLIDLGWDDVGTWDAVWRLAPKDGHDNARHGRVVLDQCERTLVWSDGPRVLATGLQDAAVVASSNGVLVMPRQEAQRVGQLASAFSVAETRPWGSFLIIDEGSGYKVKRLQIAPYHRTSEQRHTRRTEQWTVVSGVADVLLEGRTLELGPGDTLTIPVGATHRLGNSGASPLIVIEVQTGTYLEEDDISRVDDDYGRA